MKLDHPSPFAARWRAHWVWFRPPALAVDTATRMVLADPTDRLAFFRRTFTLESVPTHAPARIWIDGRYVLRINGVEVGRGPVRCDPRAAHYDVVDIAPYLQPGENVIAIIGRHFGHATSWWMPVPPSYSMGAGSLVFEALIGDEWIVTDRQWRCSPGDAWTPVAVPGDVACLPLESFDARQFPTGWDRAGFDDSEWKRAQEITPFNTGGHNDPHAPSEPFGMLRPPVRHAFQSGRINPATCTFTKQIAATELIDDPVRQVLNDEVGVREGATAQQSATLFGFTFAGTVAGTVRLEISGAKAGTIFDFAAAEHLDENQLLVTLGQHAGFRYVSNGETNETFETFDIIGTTYLHCVVRTPDGSPAPQPTISVHDRHRPRVGEASFSCSDPLLNDIYAVGLRTVDLRALDAYVDCPTREQRAWTGDSVVHQMVDFVVNEDWSMPLWHPQLATGSRSDGMLQMAAASDFAQDDRMFVPDWSLHWVHSVWNIYRYSGDRELVADLLPIAERTLRWFESFLGDDGLLHNVTGWVLLDWSSVYSKGCSSTLNALWARALNDFAEMSEWIGNNASAGWARQRVEQLRSGFEKFWDEDRGTYIDHIVDGVAQVPAAQHPSAAAICAGLVPANRIDRVIDRIIDRDRLVRHSFVMDPVTPTGGSTGYGYLMLGYPEPEWDAVEQVVEAEPFFRYMVHDAMQIAGRGHLIADRCRDWKVFLDAGETTWPECWTGGTRCHGWSSTPTRDLVVHVLGITPAEPGYAAVNVSPQLGDLEWARATVPTPHGLITVEAFADGRVEIDSPVPVIRNGVRD